ncbi:hypothetical protein H920_11495 [Fukomys damarensis]|uniref:Uncharacterized protein n=1 Tax=Fukomys damarensis TaxID=885580 RepID=A0A091DA06_FUKDA|nr:hypothetical protein H920_11495 [Fukomys damarensis]
MEALQEILQSTDLELKGEKAESRMETNQEYFAVSPKGGRYALVPSQTLVIAVPELDLLQGPLLLWDADPPTPRLLSLELCSLTLWTSAAPRSRVLLFTCIHTKGRCVDCKAAPCHGLQQEPFPQQHYTPFETFH